MDSKEERSEKKSKKKKGGNVAIGQKDNLEYTDGEFLQAVEDLERSRDDELAHKLLSEAHNHFTEERLVDKRLDVRIEDIMLENIKCSPSQQEADVMITLYRKEMEIFRGSREQDPLKCCLQRFHQRIKSHIKETIQAKDVESAKKLEDFCFDFLLFVKNQLNHVKEKETCSPSLGDLIAYIRPVSLLLHLSSFLSRYRKRSVGHYGKKALGKLRTILGETPVSILHVLIQNVVDSSRASKESYQVNVEFLLPIWRKVLTQVSDTSPQYYCSFAVASNQACQITKDEYPEDCKQILKTCMEMTVPEDMLSMLSSEAESQLPDEVKVNINNLTQHFLQKKIDSKDPLVKDFIWNCMRYHKKADVREDTKEEEHEETGTVEMTDKEPKSEDANKEMDTMETSQEELQIKDAKEEIDAMETIEEISWNADEDYKKENMQFRSEDETEGIDNRVATKVSGGQKDESTQDVEKDCDVKHTQKKKKTDGEQKKKTKKKKNKRKGDKEPQSKDLSAKKQMGAMEANEEEQQSKYLNANEETGAREISQEESRNGDVDYEKNGDMRIRCEDETEGIDNHVATKVSGGQKEESKQDVEKDCDVKYKKKNKRKTDGGQKRKSKKKNNKRKGDKEPQSKGLSATEQMGAMETSEEEQQSKDLNANDETGARKTSQEESRNGDGDYEKHGDMQIRCEDEIGGIDKQVATNTSEGQKDEAAQDDEDSNVTLKQKKKKKNKGRTGEEKKKKRRRRKSSKKTDKGMKRKHKSSKKRQKTPAKEKADGNSTTGSPGIVLSSSNLTQTKICKFFRTTTPAKTQTTLDKFFTSTSSEKVVHTLETQQSAPSTTKQAKQGKMSLKRRLLKVDNDASKDEDSECIVLPTPEKTSPHSSQLGQHSTNKYIRVLKTISQITPGSSVVEKETESPASNSASQSSYEAIADEFGMMLEFVECNRDIDFSIEDSDSSSTSKTLAHTSKQTHQLEMKLVTKISQEEDLAAGRNVTKDRKKKSPRCKQSLQFQKEAKKKFPVDDPDEEEEMMRLDSQTISEHLQSCQLNTSSVKKGSCKRAFNQTATHMSAKKQAALFGSENHPVTRVSKKKQAAVSSSKNQPSTQVSKEKQAAVSSPKNQPSMQVSKKKQAVVSSPKTLPAIQVSTKKQAAVFRSENHPVTQVSKKKQAAVSCPKNQPSTQVSKEKQAAVFRSENHPVTQVSKKKQAALSCPKNQPSTQVSKEKQAAVFSSENYPVTQVSKKKQAVSSPKNLPEIQVSKKKQAAVSSPKNLPEIQVSTKKQAAVSSSTNQTSTQGSGKKQAAITISKNQAATELPGKAPTLLFLSQFLEIDPDPSYIEGIDQIREIHRSKKKTRKKRALDEQSVKMTSKRCKQDFCDLIDASVTSTTSPAKICQSKTTHKSPANNERKRRSKKKRNWAVTSTTSPAKICQSKTTHKSPANNERKRRSKKKSNWADRAIHAHEHRRSTKAPVESKGRWGYWVN